MALTVAVAMNLIIAAAYAAIGIWITPKFQLGPISWGTRIARLSGLIFFLTCALTHVEMALHATDTSWQTEWHGLSLHVVQAIAGWTFLIAAVKYLRVRIYSQSDYWKEVESHLVELEAYEKIVRERIRKLED